MCKVEFVICNIKIQSNAIHYLKISPENYIGMQKKLQTNRSRGQFQRMSKEMGTTVLIGGLPKVDGMLGLAYFMYYFQQLTYYNKFFRGKENCFQLPLG